MTSLVLRSLFVMAVLSFLPAKNLEIITTYDPPNHELLDVEISGDYAYVPGGLGGLNIIDISVPAAPVAVSQYSGYGCDFGRLYAWSVAGDFAYGSGRDCGIKVVDVSNPMIPFHVANYRSAEHPRYEQTDVLFEPEGNSYLYAAAHKAGVEILDITFPERIDHVSTVLTENAWAVEVAADGDFVYVADGASGIKILDVRVAGEAAIIGAVESSGTAKDVIEAGNFIFVAVGARGVDMFDVSDKENPLLVANYNTTGYASRIAVSGNHVAVSDWDDVEILEWSDAPSLTLAGYKNSGGRVMAINMVEDVVFSAEWRFFRTFRFGSIEDSDIDLSLRSVDFQHTADGECRDTSLVITNNGLAALTIIDARTDHEDYNVSFPSETVLPGESMTATISYCALSGRGLAFLTIESSDPDEPTVSVRMEGNSPFGLEAGETAPDFSLQVVNDVNGNEIKLSELRDQIVIVAFFASW